jgi:hypothetical protein
MHRVYSEDILPCLTLPNADVRKILIIKIIFENLFLLNSFHQKFLKQLNKMM